MRSKGTHMVRGALALTLCLALAGCGAQGTSADSDDADATRPQSSLVITQIEPEESEDSEGKGKRTGDANATEFDHDMLSTCLGTIAEKVADDHGNPLVEKETVRDLFHVTLEGEEFELPCLVTTFLDKEWIFEQQYTFGETQYDPGFSFEVAMWYKSDPNFVINVKLKNVEDEIVEWSRLMVVGLTIRPMDSFVEFENKLGISRDSDLDDLLEILGCNDESALDEDRIFVQYRVSLYEKPFYDRNSSLYADVSYDWNKEGKAMTRFDMQLLEPWDADLLKTDEELEKEREEREESEQDDFDEQTAGVGRTVEGA